MQFKYILDKSSKKFKCPKCNSLRYVRFINNETSEYIDYNFGRCDREQECGYFNLPSSNTKSIIYSSFYETKTEVPSYLDSHLVSKTLTQYENNNFTLYLKSLFDEQKVTEVINKYKIGTSKYFENSTVFWQIDQLEKVHHGKVMMYDQTTGKRAKNKEGKGIFSTVRSLLKLDDFVLNQCLFGLHLIDENTKVVALVEAEKTAVIMSIFKPEYVWLATGSKGGFKYDYLKLIKNYKIVVFPDKSEYLDWNNKAIELNGFGFKISVSDWLENTDYPNGTDLADVYINELKAEPPQQISWQPLKENEFSKGSLEVYRNVQERKTPKVELTKEESYKAIQYFIGNNTDTYRL